MILTGSPAHWTEMYTTILVSWKVLRFSRERNRLQKAKPNFEGNPDPNYDGIIPKKA